LGNIRKEYVKQTRHASPEAKITVFHLSKALERLAIECALGAPVESDQFAR
jgi:hypothetical protein